MAIDGRDVGSSPGGATGVALACSDWARSQGLDPVGNAGHYEGFLLVEQPLPWPFDVSTVPELVDVAELAASAGLRLQTVMQVSPLAPGQQQQPEPNGAGERQDAKDEASRPDLGPRSRFDRDPDRALDRGPGLDQGPGLDPDRGPSLNQGPDRPRRLICYRTARPGWAGPSSVPSGWRSLPR